VKGVLLAIGCGLLLVGCGDESPPPTASASGETLFNHHCASCHRPEGTGNFLRGIPPNALTGMDIREVVDLIQKGDPARPKMPAFPHLSRNQAERITLHLWHLRKTLIERRSES